MNKVFWLAAIFAIAVLTGCSSPSLPTSTNIPAGHLTGTMSDWTSAICERGSGPLPMAHGRMLGGAPNPMVCQGLMQTGSGTRMPVPISIGTYTSESLMENDLSRVGAYAKGNDGSEYVVLAALSTLGPSLPAESRRTASDQAVAKARSTGPLGHGAVMSYSYGRAISTGVLLADDAALRELDDALRIAERSSEDLALGLARFTLGVALVHRDSPADRATGTA